VDSPADALEEFSSSRCGAESSFLFFFAAPEWRESFRPQRGSGPSVPFTFFSVVVFLFPVFWLSEGSPPPVLPSSADWLFGGLSPQPPNIFRNTLGPFLPSWLLPLLPHLSRFTPCFEGFFLFFS